MEIKIDEQKILSEILERDGDLHIRIKDKVRDQLVETVVQEIQDKFMDSPSWNRSTEEVSKRVLEDIEGKLEEMVKKILKAFYESYRYQKADLKILKKLKEFIEEN